MRPLEIPTIFWSRVPPGAPLQVLEIEENLWGIFVDINDWERRLAVEDKTLAYGYSSKEKAEEACQRLREASKSRKSQEVARLNWTQVIQVEGVRLYVRRCGRSYGIMANLEGQEYLLVHDDCAEGSHECTYSGFEVADSVCARFSEEIKRAPRVLLPKPIPEVGTTPEDKGRPFWIAHYVEIAETILEQKERRERDVAMDRLPNGRRPCKRACCDWRDYGSDWRRFEKEVGLPPDEFLKAVGA